jgi:hypothetical protein
MQVLVRTPHENRETSSSERETTARREKCVQTLALKIIFIDQKVALLQKKIPAEYLPGYISSSQKYL